MDLRTIGPAALDRASAQDLAVEAVDLCLPALRSRAFEGHEAEAYNEFDEDGRMKPSSYYDRIVDVMEELVRFTVLLRPHAARLVDRYSERKDRNEPVNSSIE